MITLFCSSISAPPSPQNVLIQSDTVDNSSSILATWNPPNLYGTQMTQDDVHYKVYFSPSDRTGRPTDGEFIFRICDANYTQASVTDLSPKSYYRIKVATAFCRAVESEGPPTIIKTLDIIPSAPLNLKLEGIKPNAFAISWEPPILKGDITNYTIYVTDGAGEPIIVKIDSSTTIYAIYNLYEGTTYDVRVTASSDNGESPQSAPLEVTTDVFIPNAPRNLRAVNVNLTSVTLDWDPPLPGAGMIRGYQVNYTTNFRNFQQVDVQDPSVTMATVSNLMPATSYYFQVFATTMKRVGYGSAIIMNKTTANVPTIPMSVRKQLLDKGLQTIKLSWQPPENPYGPITQYILRWGVRGGATRKEVLTPYLLTWDSDLLDDNTTHDFKLSAVNPTGEGKPVSFSIKTEPKDKIIPPNVRVRRNTTGNVNRLIVTWDTPKVPVDGFWILYRKFEWVYSGRWQLAEIPDPNAREFVIVVKEKGVSYIVVCKGFRRPQRSNSNLTNQKFSFPGQPTGQRQSNTWI
ncbi:hypothetical protein FSP39_008525 [Pinctada imbricata]|uniref:Fibronectin type-III domain-containing protein n=1 Tax=Pinctada imbricata TaxID=66713 RepID=A0AA88XDY7_PINIB|nr:hypothetical protein FSP39_008525 [Pinctada imbricata]